MGVLDTMARIKYRGHVRVTTMSLPNRSAVAGAEFESIVAETFRQAGWRVRRHPAAGDMRADLLLIRVRRSM
jgi:hypothetical protein